MGNEGNSFGKYDIAQTKPTCQVSMAGCSCLRSKDKTHAKPNLARRTRRQSVSSFAKRHRHPSSFRGSGTSLRHSSKAALKDAVTLVAHVSRPLLTLSGDVILFRDRVAMSANRKAGFADLSLTSLTPRSWPNSWASSLASRSLHSWG